MTGGSGIQRLRPSRIAGRLRRGWHHRLESWRERIETIEERRLLEIMRADRPVCWVEEEGESEPLVTIRIATFDRGDIVRERAISSALAQDYERLEILVVGDNCSDETAAAVRSVRDPRVRFVNLPSHGIYPAGRRERRTVAGSYPMNAALFLATGAWIAPCDDDDELTRDHVSALLTEAKSRGLEMVYSKTDLERAPGQWAPVGAYPPALGQIAHGSVLYSSGLRFMRHSNTSWRMNEPSDWNLWKRMIRIGVRIGFLDRITYIAHLGAFQRSRHKVV